MKDVQRKLDLSLEVGARHRDLLIPSACSEARLLVQTLNPKP